MTPTEFRDRLSARAGSAGVVITADVQAQLEAYFQLLTRWNERVNLTALPLRRPTDQTFDRLLIEPLAAARFVADSARTWFDVGSGGGSPAIPLKIAHPRVELTMIESKGRKAAFLGEAVRALGLQRVHVQSERFEDVVDRTRPHTIDLISVRAVKSDNALRERIHLVVGRQGQVFLFHSPTAPVQSHPWFEKVEVVPLRTNGDAKLTILKPLFHVEHNE